MTRMSLKILRGVDLLAQDVNLLSEDSSDPYCDIYSNGCKVARTPTQNQTLEPIWGGPNSMVEFEDMANDSEIMIKIFDQDLLKSDDPMGQVAFLASALLEMTEHSKYPNVWLPVQSLDGCEATGKLQVRIQRLPDDKSSPPPASAPTPNPSPANGARHNQPPRELRESALSALSAGPKLRDAGIGCTVKSLRRLIISSHAPVTLHIYDVSLDSRIATINSIAKSLNGGLYHAAVEIYGREYSFGGSKHDTTGIFACKPRKCPMHHYRESLYLGDCDLSPRQVNQIIRKMKPEWMAPTYDLLRKNCCFFSKEFVTELGVGSIPEWIYSLANVGAAIDDYYNADGSNNEEKKVAREGRAEDKRKATTMKPSSAQQKKKSSAPEWGMPPTRSESEISVVSSSKRKTKEEDGCGREMTISSCGCDHNASDLIDNVMAARVQRAYRSSIVARRPPAAV